MFETDNVNESLVDRIRNYISRDINSKFLTEENISIDPKSVHIVTFCRVATSWRAFASAYAGEPRYYELIHDGVNSQTIVNVYECKSSHEAII